MPARSADRALHRHGLPDHVALVINKYQMLPNVRRILHYFMIILYKNIRTSDKVFYYNNLLSNLTVNCKLLWLMQVIQATT